MSDRKGINPRGEGVEKGEEGLGGAGREGVTEKEDEMAHAREESSPVNIILARKYNLNILVHYTVWIRGEKAPTRYRSSSCHSAA